MKPTERRRFEALERSLDSSSVYVREPRTDAELTEALTNRTAVPADLQQVFDICAADLEIRLIQEGAVRRVNPDYGCGRKILQPFDMAAEILRYPAEDDPGFEIEWRPFEPDIWIRAQDRRSSGGRPLMPFVFTSWAHSHLVAQLVDYDPLALKLRHRLDEWIGGGDPPVDLLRYPEAREYLLLDPINHPAKSCFDIPMLRYPHKDLYFSMQWDRFDEPEDGHVWTTVDSLGRLAIPSLFR